MTTISSAEMRERVLSRFGQTASEKVDWQKVIGVEGNRRLLALVIAREPGSVAELATLAGRAQSNVSRSLVALVRSGLVELRQNGRVSTPVATRLGREKAAALELAHVDAEEEAPSARARLGGFAPPPMMVQFDERPADASRVTGAIEVGLRPRGSNASLVAFGRGDLTGLAERWVRDWWRIHYRRDSFYRLCELSALRGGVRSALNLLVKSQGRRVEFSARFRGAGEFGLAKDQADLPIEAFQRMLRDCLLDPVADELDRRGERDRPLHGLLARLEEIEASARDSAFWRTAGALNLPPEALPSATRDAVSRLVAEIPEEEARLEFASSLVFDEMIEATRWIEDGMAENGERNRLTDLYTIAETCRAAGNLAGLKPYARGLELAKLVRGHLKLASDQPVGGLPGLARWAGAPDFRCSGPAPGDLLGFQGSRREVPSVIVNGDGREASFFLLGRAIGDYLAFGERQACIAQIYTDRQAINRAFAAELVAPSAAVVDMVDEGVSWKQVAGHFGTSTAVIRHQFDNNADRRGYRDWGV